MVKRVLDVGNCAADHAAIRTLIERGFDATVTRTHGEHDTLAVLRAGQFDLVLVNRLLDRGGEGRPIISRIKNEPDLASVPVMLVTDYPEHQRAAVEVGAEYGFGKSELHMPATREKLQRFLASAADQE